MKNEKYKMRMRNAIRPRAHGREAKSKMRNIKGFSLIELVFAMSFLALIIFGVVSLQSSNLAMMSGNNNQIQANLYANQAIQIIKALGYGAVNSAYDNGKCGNPCSKILKNDGSAYSLVNYTSSQEEIGDAPFMRKIEINEIDNMKGYKITAIIEWADATGEHKRSDNSQVEAKLVITQ